MKKRALRCLCFVLLSCALSFGKMYKSKHFIIQTELDHRFVGFIENVAETYYANMLEYGLASKGKGRLTVYYSETESEAKHLFKLHGYNGKQGNYYYAADIPAVYVYRRAGDGEYVGWRPLFYGITYHLVNRELVDAPVWFKEGVSCFFSEKGQLIKSELVFDSVNPKQQQLLRKELEKVGRANIKRLYSSTAERFYTWNIGIPFAKTFFYWLCETGQLKNYMNVVKTDGFELVVLEKTLSRSFSKINMELSRFIKKNVYADAYLGDGRQASDESEKERLFGQALELRFGYYAVYLDLAKLHYLNKEYEKSIENLELILVQGQKREYRQVVKLMAKVYYRKKDFPKALDYYMKAWEYSDYDEYKYRLAFGIANCHYHLKDLENARKWYKRFLKDKWEIKPMQKAVEYAEKFVEYRKALAEAKTEAKEKPMQKAVKYAEKFVEHRKALKETKAEAKAEAKAKAKVKAKAMKDNK